VTTRFGDAQLPIDRPAWLPEDVWPYNAHAIEVDHSHIAYYETGEGPTLLLVHTGLWSFIWRDLIRVLSARFRCIALDAPGTGQSPVGSSQPTLDRAAQAAKAVIESLGLRELTLIVHDLGGITGLVGAARSTANVLGLVAINAFAWAPVGFALRSILRALGSAAVREIDAWTRLVPRVSAMSFGIGRHLDRKSRDAFLAGFQAAQVRSFHRYLADARRCDALYLEAAGAIAGAYRDVPVLTIFGEHNDPFHFQTEWKQRFRKAEQLVLSRGNHFPMCDDPSFVAAAITRWHACHN
jgi:pimeloyl-ACP methyl ester carboxylesterase